MLIGHTGSRALLLPILTLVALPVFAADTVETWERGARDVETYFGYEGRRSGGARRLASELVFGYGLTSGLCAYVGTNVEDLGPAAPRATSLTAGLFGTPIDSRHFDLDLFVSARTAVGYGEHELVPAIEVNLDYGPDRESFGGYLRLAVPMLRGEGSPAWEHAIELVPGAYLTLAGRHQFLVEWDTTLHPGGPGPSDRGIAFGYNVALSETIEIVSELHVTLRTAGQGRAVAFTAGLIATLP